MPHLLIRGVSTEQIRGISAPLVRDLADVCQCPEDYILLECLHTTAVYAGELVPSYPFVEVNWFDRGREVRDRAAARIDHHIRSTGVEEVEIAFRCYEKESYYAKGQSFGEPAGEPEELEKLRADNQRLKDELQRVRKASQAGAGTSMSSRLYDALRE
jgi:hypothetical protein